MLSNYTTHSSVSDSDSSIEFVVAEGNGPGSSDRQVREPKKCVAWVQSQWTA